MRTLTALLEAAVLAGAALAAHAKVVEQQLDVPVEVKDAYGKAVAQAIKVTVFFDDTTPAPRPVVVINHGRASEAQDRAALGRARFSDTARWFARLGFAVAVPTRLGYGVTGGEDVEDSGACTRKNFPPGYAAATQQTLAVLAIMRERPDVAQDRAVVLGQSYGGATSIAVAALNPPGVVATINFAGGGGGDPKTHPREPCAPHRMEALFAGFGRGARLPTLWIYTENDQYFGPQYPRDWFKAYREAGGAGEFVQFPPHGDDGHALFTRFPEVWRPRVVEFLRQRGFEMKEAP